MQLVGISEIRGSINAVTGLRIGAGDLEMRIGGVDNTVVRGARDGFPYIPGSSLKGKIRSLLEWRSGSVGAEPLGRSDLKRTVGTARERVEKILKLFGVSGDVSTDGELLPTRAGFSDAPMIAEHREGNLPFVEVKSENQIDRLTGVAKHPRQTERVAAGVRFQFQVTVRKFAGDPDLVSTLLEGMRMLELDGLGGSVSRGYGKVKFSDLTLDGSPIQDRFDSLDPFAGT